MGRITRPDFGRILTFEIGGTAKLEIPPFGHGSPPKPAIRMNASRETVREGKFLYGTICFYCHGSDAVAAALPDLRYASVYVHQQFEAIVLGGACEPRGMPPFKDLLTPSQVRAIQAYVLSRAAASAKPPSK